MLSFDVSREDHDIIERIVDRAITMAGSDAPPRMQLAMDLTATHANGCRLRLQDILAADNFNFAHDVWGIRNHLDRTTGQLRNCFVPRFAEEVA